MRSSRNLRTRLTSQNLRTRFNTLWESLVFAQPLGLGKKEPLIHVRRTTEAHLEAPRLSRSANRFDHDQIEMRAVMFESREETTAGHLLLGERAVMFEGSEETTAGLPPSWRERERERERRVTLRDFTHKRVRPFISDLSHWTFDL